MRNLVLVILMLIAGNLQSQSVATSLDILHQHQLQSHVLRGKLAQPMAFLPVLMPMGLVDSISDADTKHWTRKEQKGFILRKLRNEHLIEIRTKDFSMNGDLALNLEMAKQTDNQGRRQFTNTRGLVFNGAIGNRFFFNTSFYENQAIMPDYMDSVSVFRGTTNDQSDLNSGRGRGSVPGFGRWKPFNTSDTSYSYDYTLTTGTIGFKLNERSFIQLGHDKQFLGYGYRSILLSDVSAPYAFLRLNLSFFEDKLTYTTNYALLQSLEKVIDGNPRTEDLFKKQGGRFSYLHFQPNHQFGIGLFDATTWIWHDNTHPRNAEYFLPTAFVYSGKGIDNHLVGLNTHFNPTSFLMLYGQTATNTSNSGNFGYQLGAKVLDPIPGLTVILEYNSTGAGLYETNDGGDTLASSTEPFEKMSTQNYFQHNDQMLAHPFGIEMSELIVKASYRFRDFMLSGSYNYSSKLPSINTVKTDFFQFEAAYIINSRSNAQIVFGNINRIEDKSPVTLHDTYTYFAIRTHLTNRYLDF